MLNLFINTSITIFLWFLSSIPEISCDRELQIQDIKDFQFVSMIFFVSSIVSFYFVYKIKSNLVRIIFTIFLALLVLTQLGAHIRIARAIDC